MYVSHIAISGYVTSVDQSTKTYSLQWFIEMHGVKDSRESLLSGQLDEDEYKQSTLGVVNILLSETKRNIEKMQLMLWLNVF